MKPNGTMVKRISGHYYVYEYSNVTENGKRRTKMGRVIGKIKEGVGFVPNTYFLSQNEISTVDFGEYAVVLANSRKTLELLRACFHPEDAVKIYCIALIHFIQGFTSVKDIKSYFDMSYLSLKYPTLKLGQAAVSKLYDDLGRRGNSVFLMKQKLVDASSGQIAVFSQAFSDVSHENDSFCEEYEFPKRKESQKHLLMAYDVNTRIPLFSHIVEAEFPDEVSVQDLLQQVELKDILFIMGSGVYSEETLELCQANGSSYVIRLPQKLSSCRKAIPGPDACGRFFYQQGQKSTVIEHKEECIDGHRVFGFRDINESIARQTDYLCELQQGETGYSEEEFLELKDLMGLYVLQTSLPETKAEDIFQLYQKRRTVESSFNDFRELLDCRALEQEDYCKLQGLAFVMLVSALIHQEFALACKDLKGKSIQDCLLEARMLKAGKLRGVWMVTNCLKKQVDLCNALNTELTI
ncbi:MAG: transposase [Bacillota bacterium]|nr:transposase [Bacillota bacterium]